MQDNNDNAPYAEQVSHEEEEETSQNDGTSSSDNNDNAMNEARASSETTSCRHSTSEEEDESSSDDDDSEAVIPVDVPALLQMPLRDGNISQSSSSGSGGGGPSDDDQDEEEESSRSEQQEDQAESNDSGDSMSALSPHNTHLAPRNVDFTIKEELTDQPENTDRIIKHLAKRYVLVKQEYRKAAVDMLVYAAKLQGGRFLDRLEENDIKKWAPVNHQEASARASRMLRLATRGRVKSDGSHNAATNSNKNSSASSDNAKKDDADAAGLQPPHDGQVGEGLTEAAVSAHNTREGAKSAVASATTDHQEINHTMSQKSKMEMMALQLEAGMENRTYVSLTVQPIDLEYTFRFAKALSATSTVKSLSLTFRCPLPSIDACALSWGIMRCKSLQQVRLQLLDGCLPETKMILQGVVDNSSIRSLNIDHNNIDDDALRVFQDMMLQSKNCKLERLSLEKNPISESGAMYIARIVSKCDTLRYLCIAGCYLGQKGHDQVHAAVEEKKKTRLFEVSGGGLDAVNYERQREQKHKRPASAAQASASSEDEVKPKEKKKARPNDNNGEKTGEDSSEDFYAGSRCKYSSGSTTSQGGESAPTSSDSNAASSSADQSEASFPGSHDGAVTTGNTSSISGDTDDPAYYSER